jgi:NADH-quinone oxidoreductase subunit F
MIVSAHATQADVAFIFLRRSTRQETVAKQLLKRMPATTWKYPGFGLQSKLILHLSAGRYICGEGSALLNSLEGKRAIPRDKTPRPTHVGLWGRPTTTNNVETICNIPHIVNNGAEWFKALSLTECSGTKIYGASGKVNKPGAWELPMGTTIREIFEEHAGGMRAGLKFRGVMPGGASTEFLLEDHLDVPMDFDSVQKAGSRLGTGTMVLLDDQTCPVGMVHNLEKFFARESCGHLLGRPSVDRSNPQGY